MSWRPVGEVLPAQLGDIGGLLECDCVAFALNLDVQQVGHGPLVFDAPALLECGGELVVERAVPVVLYNKFTATCDPCHAIAYMDR